MRAFIISAIALASVFPAAAIELDTAGVVVGRFRSDVPAVKHVGQRTIEHHIVAFEAANAGLRGRGDRELYCPPEETVFDAANIANMVQVFYTAKPDLKRRPFAVVMLVTLEAVYPCMTPAEAAEAATQAPGPEEP